MTATTGRLRVFTVTDEETLHALRSDWTDLLRRSASDGPFLTWEWLASWWRHLLPAVCSRAWSFPHRLPE